MKAPSINRQPATAGDFDVIPQSALDSGKVKTVHVEGWGKGCKFRYIKTVNGFHHLETPKTHRKYSTSNRLLYLRQKGER